MDASVTSSSAPADLSRMTPQVAAYAAALPQGLRSYPELAVKHSVVRAWFDGHDLDRLADALPRELDPAELLQRPVTAWTTEVHATAVYLAVRDVFFASDDAYVRAAHLKNVRLLASPLYRAFCRLFSEQRIQKTSAAVFRGLHRGLDLSAEPRGDTLCWTLGYPAHLVPELIARCYGTAIAAALELGGSSHFEVVMDDHLPTRSVFHLRRRT